MIRSLPVGKSPVQDGLTKDYYKQFMENLTPSLSSVFTAAMTSASFPSERLQAYIVTIQKPGKDPTSSTIYRPISLLNADVYAKILAQIWSIQIRQALFLDARRQMQQEGSWALFNKLGPVGCLLCCYPWMLRRLLTISIGNTCTRHSKNLGSQDLSCLQF